MDSIEAQRLAKALEGFAIPDVVSEWVAAIKPGKMTEEQKKNIVATFPESG